jgi:GH15 family glucan-1,4-alpha-glucosidase
LAEIDNYGIVGDCHSAALISKEGSVDWLCFPRFDSPSVFAKLLDARNGGYFEARPRGKFAVHQRYIDETAILESVFRNKKSSVSIRYFMPIYERRKVSPMKRAYGIDESIATYHRLVTTIIGQRGKTTIGATLAPMFQYARLRPSIRLDGADGLVAHGDMEALILSHLEKRGKRTENSWRLRKGKASHSFLVGKGERHDIVLTYHRGGGERPKPLSRAAVDHEFDRTKLFWKGWVGVCRYRGRYHDQVVRSLITLKLLTYAPTGAMIAAPTTSLPEAPGWGRNWDYRYTWIRDAAFTSMAFLRLGYLEEAEGLMYWLAERVKVHGRDLPILACVDGDPPTEEKRLPWLTGYKSSKPVRIGNAAADQNQLDVFGEILNTFYYYSEHKNITTKKLLHLVFKLVDHVAEHWSDTDLGIWEFRTSPQHYVYSKAMCWLALERGITLAERDGLKARANRWRKSRDLLKKDVLKKGFSEKLESFVMAYDCEDVDASLLLLPRIGFLKPEDDRIKSTLKAVVKRLAVDDLLYRYRVPDGLSGNEGCFMPASFWWIDYLVRMNRMDEAGGRFERLLKYMNHLGLYSEEIDPKSNKQLGNFPQAYTHVGLINSALDLAARNKRGKRY